MLPIRNISYLLPMCCSFWEKCINSQKTGLGCSTPLKSLVSGFQTNLYDSFNWVYLIPTLNGENKQNTKYSPSLTYWQAKYWSPDSFLSMLLNFPIAMVILPFCLFIFIIDQAALYLCSPLVWWPTWEINIPRSPPHSLSLSLSLRLTLAQIKRQEKTWGFFVVTKICPGLFLP